MEHSIPRVAGKVTALREASVPTFSYVAGKQATALSFSGCLFAHKMGNISSLHFHFIFFNLQIFFNVLALKFLSLELKKINVCLAGRSVRSNIITDWFP